MALGPLNIFPLPIGMMKPVSGEGTGLHCKEKGLHPVQVSLLLVPLSGERGHLLGPLSIAAGVTCVAPLALASSL
jgi:hypothetical protein